MIADGSEEADLRLEASLTTDSGIGSSAMRRPAIPLPARWPRAGAVDQESIKVPCGEPEATFGPKAARPPAVPPHTV